MVGVPSVEMASAPPKVLVVLGSTRDGRLGFNVAKMVTEQLSSAGVDATLIGETETPRINLIISKLDPDSRPAELRRARAAPGHAFPVAAGAAGGARVDEAARPENKASTS